MTRFSLKVEFTRGLLQEVEVKLRRDVQDMVQDDLLMAHLIDELLLFNRELMLLGYPPSFPSPLSLLLDTTSFSKWIALERQCKTSTTNPEPSIPSSNYSMHY